MWARDERTVAAENVKTSDTVELKVPSDPRYMGIVRDVISRSADHAGFAEEDARQIVLAVDEGCTNIIRHCYGGDTSQKIIVTCAVGDDYLEIRLRDFGEKPDPAKIRSRPLEDIRPGGLGVHLIHTIMDEVEYDTSPDVGTILRMRKTSKGGHKPDQAGDEGNNNGEGD